MSTQNNVEIISFKRRIIEATVLPDGSCRLVFDDKKDLKKASFDETFVLIRASELSASDRFISSFVPMTYEQKVFKNELLTVIRKGVKDFWKPRFDPTFDENNKGIAFALDSYIATERTYKWWVNAAKEFWPERNSRLGTYSQYVAFLGVLIKTLFESGWSLLRAWHAVCNDSSCIGHYCDSNDAKFELEKNASREICGFYDLGNAFKLLASDDESDNALVVAGGNYKMNGHTHPLNFHIETGFINQVYYSSVGWIVFD